MGTSEWATAVPGSPTVTLDQRPSIVAYCVPVPSALGPHTCYHLFGPDESSCESGMIMIFALQMSKLAFAYFKLAQGLLAVSGP